MWCIHLARTVKTCMHILCCTIPQYTVSAIFVLPGIISLRVTDFACMLVCLFYIFSFALLCTLTYLQAHKIYKHPHHMHTHTWTYTHRSVCMPASTHTKHLNVLVDKTKTTTDHLNRRQSCTEPDTDMSDWMTGNSKVRGRPRWRSPRNRWWCCRTQDSNSCLCYRYWQGRDYSMWR